MILSKLLGHHHINSKHHDIMKNTILRTLITLTVVLASCKEGEDPSPSVVQLSYDFEYNEEEWIGGFSDLPQDGQDIYELAVDHRPLPEESGEMGNAIMIQGHNRSDDLF